MAQPTYSPATTHAASVGATIQQNGVSNAASIPAGLSAGRLFTELTDGLAPTNVLIPTGVTADGYPGPPFLGFTTSSINSVTAASVTVT